MKHFPIFLAVENRRILLSGGGDAALAKRVDALTQQVAALKKGAPTSPKGGTSASVEKRLKALEARVAQDGIILTEDQLVAMEKAKLEKQAHGEIETEHPGYLGAQDTFYVGCLKGVGRIYQQTFIDQLPHCLAQRATTGQRSAGHR